MRTLKSGTVRWRDGRCVAHLDVLRPEIVGHELRAGPVLAVHIGSLAREETVVGVLDDGKPGGGFGVL
jgi:hypothetical protein